MQSSPSWMSACQTRMPYAALTNHTAPVPQRQSNMARCPRCDPLLTCEAPPTAICATYNLFVIALFGHHKSRTTSCVNEQNFSCRFSFERDINRKLCSYSDLTFDLDSAAVQFHQFPGNR